MKIFELPLDGQHIEKYRTKRIGLYLHLTSKQDLFVNTSGKESMNSERKRLDGQIVHLLEPSIRNPNLIRNATTERS